MRPAFSASGRFLKRVNKIKHTSKKQVYNIGVFYLYEWDGWTFVCGRFTGRVASQTGM